MSKKINGPSTVNFSDTTPITKDGRIRVDTQPYFKDTGSEERLPSSLNLDTGNIGIEDSAGDFTGTTVLAALQELHDTLSAKTGVSTLPSVSSQILFDSGVNVAQTTYPIVAPVPAAAVFGVFKCTLDNPSGDEVPGNADWSDPAAPAPLKTVFAGFPSISIQRILYLTLPLESGPQTTWAATVPAGQNIKVELIGYGESL